MGIRAAAPAALWAACFLKALPGEHEGSAQRKPQGLAHVTSNQTSNQTTFKLEHKWPQITELELELKLELKLELGQLQSQVAQKPELRGEVGVRGAYAVRREGRSGRARVAQSAWVSRRVL